jgi:hypothetical protein
MSEARWQNAIVRSLRKCNAIVYCFAGSRFQAKGIPDTFIAHPYWNGWIEFKGENTPITVAQVQAIEKLNECGVKAFIAREPNLICNYEQDVIRKFDGVTGISLLRVLKGLS